MRIFKVGLTGGIGSGKTTVAKIFQSLGIAVYNADNEAKRLMEEDVALMEAIRRTFGKGVYKLGFLDRKYLANIIFNDEKALEKINELVHPVVQKDFHLRWANEQKSHYIIEESALLFESDLYKSFDFVISVIAPMNERIERLVLRDKGATQQQVKARIANQVSDEIRKKKSDALLYNGIEDLLLPQVIELDKRIKEKRIC